jgi:methionine-rich copper-binding protein CopC
MPPLLSRWLAASLVLAWLALIGRPADAHAIIVASTPAVDATVRGAQVPIKLKFNSRIDRDRSRLALIASDGSSMPLALDPDVPPDGLAATAKGLAPGRYRLRWQVLSVDGHITRGDIPFRVAE